MVKNIVLVTVGILILFLLALGVRSFFLGSYADSIKPGVYIEPDTKLKEFEYGKRYIEPFNQYIIQGRLIMINDKKVVIYGGGTNIWALNINQDTYYRHQKSPMNGEYYLPDEGIDSFTYPDKEMFLGDIERFMWTDAVCKDFKCEEAIGIIIVSSIY